MQDATVPQPFRVATNHAETGDTWTLTLEPEAGRFEFAPGQFTMLYAFGTGEVPISVSGDPRDPTRLAWGQSQQSGHTVGGIRRFG